MKINLVMKADPKSPKPKPIPISSANINQRSKMAVSVYKSDSEKPNVCTPWTMLLRSFGITERRVLKESFESIHIMSLAESVAETLWEASMVVKLSPSSFA